MTDSIDALAALGLDLPAAAPLTADVSTASKAESVEAEAPAPAVEVATEKTSREEVEIGDIEIGVITDIPHLQRNFGARGSKYPFDDLVPPKLREDGKTEYSNFIVKFVEGTDEGKFKRSVQSANTQRNTRAKEANEPYYSITRAINKNGKFVGMQVIRTDIRQPDEG